MQAKVRSWRLGWDALKDAIVALAHGFNLKALYVASNPGLLPPPRAHAPYVLIMRRYLRIINTYGACARGGGRKPGFEATLYARGLSPARSAAHERVNRDVDKIMEEVFGVPL